MMNIGNLKVLTPTDREILLTREFNAPRNLVFDTMSKPELIKRWLSGPPGWTMVECTDDACVGGKYRWVWRGPGGEEMAMHGVYREYNPSERVVRTEAFDQFCHVDPAIATLILSDQGDKTALTLTLVYPSKEVRDAVIASGMANGVAASYDQLDQVLASGPRTRRPGEFCWINMLTPRPAEAREFFGKVLGWTYSEIPGMGHTIKVQGHDIGGLFDLNGPQTPKGIPPCIGVMVRVDSADATCQKVTSLGGRVKPAFDIKNNLRMAVCFDPNGANFDLWEPKKAFGTEVDSTFHGAPSWFETLTTDTDRANTFYCELFGWTAETMPAAAMNYTVFKRANVSVAGMLQITPEMGKIPPHWATYFTVMNADATVRLATDLGAKICMTMKSVPGVGRFCGMTSPQGVMFYVIQYIR